MLPPATWLSSAAIVLGLSFVMKSADLILVSSGLAAIGLISALWPMLKERRFGEGEISHLEAPRLLEERLRAAEEQLAATTRELAALKEQRHD